MIYIMIIPKMCIAIVFGLLFSAALAYPQYTISRLIIASNERTHPDIITRELSFSVGSMYTNTTALSSEISNSLQNLSDLDLFSKAVFVYRITSNSSASSNAANIPVEVTVYVTEKWTALFLPSYDRGRGFMFRFMDNNFLGINHRFEIGAGCTPLLPGYNDYAYTIPLNLSYSFIRMFGLPISLSLSNELIIRTARTVTNRQSITQSVSLTLSYTPLEWLHFSACVEADDQYYMPTYMSLTYSYRLFKYSAGFGKTHRSLGLIWGDSNTISIKNQYNIYDQSNLWNSIAIQRIQYFREGSVSFGYGLEYELGCNTDSWSSFQPAPSSRTPYKHDANIYIAIIPAIGVTDLPTEIQWFLPVSIGCSYTNSIYPWQTYCNLYLTTGVRLFPVTLGGGGIVLRLDISAMYDLFSRKWDFPFQITFYDKL